MWTFHINMNEESFNEGWYGAVNPGKQLNKNQHEINLTFYLIYNRGNFFIINSIFCIDFYLPFQ
jgi:hypothetical protein